MRARVVAVMAWAERWLNRCPWILWALLVWLAVLLAPLLAPAPFLARAVVALALIALASWYGGPWYAWPLETWRALLERRVSR